METFQNCVSAMCTLASSSFVNVWVSAGVSVHRTFAHKCLYTSMCIDINLLSLTRIMFLPGIGAK